MSRNFSALNWCAALLLAGAVAACGGEEDAVGPGPIADAAGGSDGSGGLDVAGDGLAGADAAAEVGEDAGLDAADVATQDLPPEDVPPPTCSEDQKKACDDGLGCTLDECAIAGSGSVCKSSIQPGSCLIGGVCAKLKQAKLGNACLVCDPAVNSKGWTQVGPGGACEDGDACTFNDACQNGQCAGEPVVCGDGNPCTKDVCDPASGCAYPPTAATPCDDGDACSKSDLCLGGKCAGQKVSCDDGNPCTTDACALATGCTHTFADIPCSDGDACTAGDTCQGGQCQSGPAANCDDGNTCTKDVCDKGAGCYHLPFQSPCCLGESSICDDGNPCTNDLCDPATTACSHADNTAVCSDGNACTQGDVCSGGKCGGKPASCDDKNPCTTDACTPSTGCAHSAVDGGACDDGSPCTTDDKCLAGQCKGKGECACTPTFSSEASKLTHLQIGNGGHPGEGLDLDENPKTCAPSANCSGGIDNSLGALAGFANKPLQEAVDKGSLIFLLEYKNFKQGPIDLALYSAELAQSGCDVQKQTCAYTVSKSMLDPKTCQPLVALPGTLVGNTVKAGGKGTNFPFSLPLSSGAVLNITIYGARIQGTVGLTGGKVATIDGILAGAVPKSALAAAIDGLPDEGLPLPKDALKGLLDTLVEADIDADGDGVKESASISLKLKGIPGILKP